MTDGPAFRVVARGAEHPVGIVCEGELDIAAMQDLDAALRSFDADVIVDCASVTLMDAATIGLVVRHRLRLEPDGHSLRLANVDGLPHRVLQIVGLLPELAAPPRSL